MNMFPLPGALALAAVCLSFASSAPAATLVCTAGNRQIAMDLRSFGFAEAPAAQLAGSGPASAAAPEILTVRAEASQIAPLYETAGEKVTSCTLVTASGEDAVARIVLSGISLRTVARGGAPTTEATLHYQRLTIVGAGRAWDGMGGDGSRVSASVVSASVSPAAAAAR
jgi:hypothetical protein